jgi:dihydrofolate reductase
MREEESKLERCLVVAVHKGTGAIGRRQTLPWPRLKGDLRFLKWATTGQWTLNAKENSLTRHPLPQGTSSVVVGRRTFESVGCRPLAGRRNVVLTRQAPSPLQDAASSGAIEVVASLTQALDVAPRPMYILGGAQVYSEALLLLNPPCQVAFVTEVEGNVADYDTSFPMDLLRQVSIKKLDITAYVASELQLTLHHVQGARTESDDHHRTKKDHHRTKDCHDEQVNEEWDENEENGSGDDDHEGKERGERKKGEEEECYVVEEEAPDWRYRFQAYILSALG